MTDRADMRVNVTATDNASDEFQRIGRNAQQMGREIDRAADTAQRGFRGVGDSAERMARDVEGADRSMDRFSRTGAALGAVAGTAAGLLSEMARAAAEEEVAFAQLEAAVDATGESFDDLTPAIERAIDGAEDLSFADDQAAEALTRLTTITGSTQEALDLLSLTMDVARGRGISLSEAATLVGRAAEGQTAALTRMGIVLEEGATAQDALNELQRRYAGQSEAYADTTQGAIDRLKNSFDNWAESVGASTGDLQVLLTLLPGLSVGLTGLTTVVGGLVGALGPLGLAAAAVAALGAVAVMTDGFGLFGDEAERTTIEVDGLTESIYALAASGADRSLVDQALAVGAAWDEAIATYQGWLDLLNSDLPRPPEAGSATGSTLPIPDDEDIRRADELLAALAGRLDDTNVNTDGLIDSLNYLFGELQAGEITFDQFLATLALWDSQFLTIFGTLESTTEATERLNEATGRFFDTLGRLTDAGERFNEIAAARAERDRAIAEGTREHTAALEENAQARDEALAAQQAERDATQAATEARIAERDALIESTIASNLNVEAIAVNVAELNSLEFASFAAADGMVTLSERSQLLTLQIGEMGEATSELGGQISQTEGALRDMEEARAILLERQAQGIALSQEEIDFLSAYDQRVQTATGNVEDWEVAQGLLAARQLDAIEAQENLNETMGDTNTALTDLVEPLGTIADALAELLGLDASGLDPGEQTVANWERMAAAMSAATSGAVAGDASGGPSAPGVPTRDQGARGIAVGLDTEAVRLGTEEIEGYLAAVTEADWTVTILGDGEDAARVIRDTEGDVQAVVKGDYVVYIDGDNLSFKEEWDEVWAAIAAIDGRTATITAVAVTEGARAALNSLTGYQGTAYVVVNGIAGTRVGPTDLTLAAGGIVPAAASGMVVRAGELGAELVYPPGRAPYVAARDGLYVMESGSYVSNAAATRAGGVGGLTVNLTVAGNVYGVDDLAGEVARALGPALAFAAQDRYRAIGWTGGI